MGFGPNSSEAPLLDKRKGKELMARMSKRSKKKTGRTSSAFLFSLGANAKLWKPEFSAYELGKQVTVENFAKDHDTRSYPSKGFGFFEVMFISDSGKELVDRLFKDYIDSFPYPVLVVNWTFLALFELPFSLGGSPHSSLCLSYVILQPGEHLDSRHKVLEVGWRVERQILPEPLPKSQRELVARHGQFLRALFNFVVSFPIPLVVILD